MDRVEGGGLSYGEQTRCVGGPEHSVHQTCRVGSYLRLGVYRWNGFVDL